MVLVLVYSFLGCGSTSSFSADGLDFSGEEEVLVIFQLQVGRTPFPVPLFVIQKNPVFPLVLQTEGTSLPVVLNLQKSHNSFVCQKRLHLSINPIVISTELFQKAVKSKQLTKFLITTSCCRNRSTDENHHIEILNFIQQTE